MRLTALLAGLLLSGSALAGQPGDTPMPDYARYMSWCLADKVDHVKEQGVDVDAAGVMGALASGCQCEFDHLPLMGTPVSDADFAQVMNTCKQEYSADPEGFFTTYGGHLRARLDAMGNR